MSKIHNESHELRGKTVVLNENAIDPAREMVVSGAEFRVEDWWDVSAGMSWMHAEGNPAAMQYAIRARMGSHLPLDNEVVYGKIGAFGHIVHVSELGEVIQPQK